MDSKMDPYTATPRPGTASIRVFDIGWQGPLNPNPFRKDEEELVLDEYLSVSKLQGLTGFDDLRQVKTLEICVDTRENSLGNFGAYLPNLKQLKLNNSLIVSVRDLGTTLSKLSVLWMARCGLVDLDGMSSFSSLKELYLAYNNLSDLSQVTMLDHLEILDLEGNNIDDITQIQYLGLCSKLSTLTIEGNQICLKPHPESPTTEDYNYRAEVRKLIPHLKYLDEVPVDQICRRPSNVLNEDWLMVKESIKDGNIVEDDVQRDSRPGSAGGRPFSSRRPNTAQPILTSRPWTAERSLSFSRPGSARLLSGRSLSPESTSSNDMLEEDEASDLTHGVSRVICGNPTKALRVRKQKLGSSSVSTLKQLGHNLESMCDVANTNQEDIFAELKTWREIHAQRRQAVERERAPQVLRITHDDFGDGDILSNGYEEDLLQSCDDDCSSRVSSDSSCYSPLPKSPTVSASPQAQESPPSTALIYSRLLATPKYPSPPSTQGTSRTPDIRIRRLKVPSQTSTAVVTSQDKAENRTELADEVFALLDVVSAPHCSEPSVQRLEENRKAVAGAETTTRRPVIGPIAIRSPNIGSPVDKSSQNIIASHQPVIRTSTRTPERVTLLNTVRPLTAKGVLQRLPNRPALLTAPSKSTNS
ncbi:leucine-rich repeat-containing protein 56 [Lissotriton helveticus]